MPKLRSEAIFRGRLAAEVNRLCKQRGWSQAELVRRLGSYRSEATRLLNGELPTELGNLERVAHAFGISTHELTWRLLRVRRGEPDRSPHSRGRWQGQPYYEEVRSASVGHEESEQELKEFRDRLEQQFLATEVANLDSPQARRIFTAVGRLARSGELVALGHVADMLDGLTRAGGLGDTMVGVPLGSPPSGALALRLRQTLPPKSDDSR